MQIAACVLGRKLKILAFSVLLVWNFTLVFPKSEISVLSPQIQTSGLLLGGMGQSPSHLSWWGTGSLGSGAVGWCSYF